jgi:hypothetical protein
VAVSRMGSDERANPLLDAYMYGFALTNMNLPFNGANEMRAMAENMIQPLPANEYPNVTEFITEPALKSRYDHTEEFEYGLDLILDGLQRALPTA